ncbi:TPA: hypothetical protein DCG61_02375 [Patescibacteria group bacterium]|nr:hypothetical protein [Patescibacteria group bacterium]
MKSFFLKISSGITLTALIAASLISPQTAIAQFSGTGPTVPVNDSQVLDSLGYNTSLSITGVVSEVQTAIAEIASLCNDILDTVEDTENIANSVSRFEQVLNVAMSVIGGSPVEATKASVQAELTQRKIDCGYAYLEALNEIEPTSLNDANQLQKAVTEVATELNALETNLKNLQAQANAGWKDVAKAVMVRTLLTVNKNITTKLANELINRYKIDDYLAYGDAVATQIYAMKYIDQNYQGDARTQMMMRSLIQSPKAPEKARIAANFANQQAREYIANSCGSAGSLDSSNRTSLNCLAAYGDVQASPMFKYMNALDTASQIKLQADKTAQAEIAQSAGYAPPRDCSGSLSQQQQLDSRIQAVSAERDAAEAVLVRLQQALKQGQTTQAEVDKAEAAFFAADTKLVELPQEVNSPVIDICKAIDSPASYLGNQVNEWVSNLTKQSTDLKQDNLPFYANFISDIASNFLTNLLTGGKSTSQVFKEAGLQAMGAGVVSLGSLTNNNSSGGGPLTSQSLSEGDVQIYARSANSTERINVLMSGQSYVLVIDFAGLIARPGTNEDPVFNPVRAVVSGGNFEGSNNFQLSPAELAAGRIELDLTNVTQSFSINAQFYARVQGSDTPLRGGGWTQSFVVGTVGGAKTVFFNPRGEMPNTSTFRIR